LYFSSTIFFIRWYYFINFNFLQIDGKEYNNEDKKFKTEFFSKEKAEEFIKFYKWFYPNYDYKVEEIKE
jgi:hypothetical protein